MKFLKGILLSLLNLLLFFSISLFGFAYIMNQTIMDPNFTAAEVDKMDIAALASSFIQVPDSPDVKTYPSAATLNAAIKSSIKDAEPELKNELRTALYSTYDYFLGRNVSLNINISFEPVKSNLKTTLKASLLKSQPAMNDTAFNLYFDQFTKDIPPSFTLDTNKLDPTTLKTLRDVKQYIGYYDIGWKLTIPLIFILAIAIVLIENNLRASLRSLGINLFLFGAFGFVSDFALKHFAPSMTLPGLPAAVDVWLTQFMDKVLAPLNVFSIAVASIGAVLFIVSFVIKKAETA
jgi:hypothetical protein